MEKINKLDQELFYYEKIKEIKNKQAKNSSDFANQKRNFINYGAKIVHQNTLVQFDGAVAANIEDLGDDVEQQPDVILTPRQRNENYEAFNRIKKHAFEKAQKSGQKIEKLEKLGKAAQELKYIKNVKSLYNLIKIGAGITIEGLIVTWVVMEVQFVGGNIFHSKYIPKLGKIELIIFFIVLFFLINALLPFIIVPIIAAGGLGATLKGVLSVVGL